MLHKRCYSLAFASSVSAALVLASACSKHSPLPEPAAPLTPPSRLCTSDEAPPACRSALEVEMMLSDETEIVGMADPPSGTQGSKVLTLRTHHGGATVVFRAKWRPQSSSNLINEPRKELAAYAVQKLFLDDSALAAPPTVAHCFPLAEYRLFAPKEPASFKTIDCVLGFASYWLEDVHSVSSAREDGLLGEGKGIWDTKLFERDPIYRGSVARANLLTYVINHGDAHDGQFLLEETPRGLRTYVVDNSIAFRSVKNPMLLFREDWSNIHVPWLPKDAVARLRNLKAEDFQRLGTIAVLEHRGEKLVDVTRTSSPLTSDGSVMSWTGKQLRIGLSDGEIKLVASRIALLLERPDLAKITEP